MSLTAIALNGLLAILLLIALAFGVRLERRLKALRDSHEGFAKAVADLDRAAMRAEQGLADLRAATDEAADTLSDRITQAQALAAQLDERLNRPIVTPPPASSASGGAARSVPSSAT
jgi:F0F1-type ATP synthase membrane subunit b/b'